MNFKVKRHIFKKISLTFLVVFCILVFRSIVIEPFRIPSESMMPTLFSGDFILVNKMAYGLKIPFSDFNLFGFNSDPIYLFKHRLPTRGDVIVFKYPRDKSINFVKRIIALPGDIVEMKNKELFVNGRPVSTTKIEERLSVRKLNKKFKNANFNFYTAMVDERQHIIQLDENSFYGTEFPAKKIPKNMYFVLGDNRDFSYDSRFWGLVHKENIKGKALMVWFSLDINRNSSEDFFEFNPQRIGTMIQ